MIHKIDPEFFANLGAKLEIHTAHITMLGVTYEEATIGAQTLDWLQQHIIKNGGNTVDASFIVGKDEAARVWKLVKGDAPDPLLA